MVRVVVSRKLEELYCTYTRIAHYRKTGCSFVVHVDGPCPPRTPPTGPVRPAGMKNPLGRGTRPSVIGSVCN